ILPLFGLLLCMPYQQKAVGRSLVNNSFSDTIPSTSHDTAVIADTLGLKKNAVVAKTDTSTDDDELKSAIKYHPRDSAYFDVEHEIVYLYGAATVDYQDLHLKADYIKVDLNKKELYAEGSTDSLGRLF